MGAANNGRIDADSVARLYVAHSENLRSYLGSMLQDEQLAADVLQATFAKLIEKGHQTEPEKRRAWLYRVATREAMVMRRRQKTDRNAMQRVRDEATRNAPQRADHLEQEERAARLREALDRLPEKQQAVVRMRVFDGLKFSDIADRLQLPIGTVLTRMRSAMMQLQQTLRSDRIDED